MFVVRRYPAQVVCTLGLIQLLFAVALTVCGFINMGLFRVLDAKGVWFGMPLMIPPAISIFVLATRHRNTPMFVVLTSLATLIIGCFHVKNVYDGIGYWDKYQKLADSTAAIKPCINRGDECVCVADLDLYLERNYFVPRCDFFRFGYELHWTMIGLSVAGVLMSLLQIPAGFWARCTLREEEQPRKNKSSDHVFNSSQPGKLYTSSGIDNYGYPTAPAAPSDNYGGYHPDNVGGQNIQLTKYSTQLSTNPAMMH